MEKEICQKDYKIFKEFVEHYLNGELDRISNFDFYPLYPEDPDKSKEMYAIYCILWRDKIEPNSDCLFKAETYYSGETLCTNKLAVLDKYGYYFQHLDDIKKIEIKNILLEHGVGFENKVYDEEKQNIENNHQLGNFMPLPSTTTKDYIGEAKYSLNTGRSNNPFFDYFDLFLFEIQKYYENGLESTSTKLRNQFKVNQQYFAKFGSFNDYIKSNFLDDFFEGQNSNGNYVAIIELSKMNFKDYVIKKMEIIQKRGERILKELKKIYV
jgi:hypothetical protein